MSNRQYFVLEAECLVKDSEEALGGRRTIYILMRQRPEQRAAGDVVGVVWSEEWQQCRFPFQPSHDPARKLQFELKPARPDRSRGSCSLLDRAMGLRKGGPGQLGRGVGWCPEACRLRRRGGVCALRARLSSPVTRDTRRRGSGRGLELEACILVE